MENYQITKGSTKHKNYSYKILSDIYLEDDFSSSLFNGTRLLDSTFQKCSLDYVEIQGTILENTIFYNCSFRSCDFKSAYCSNVEFKDSCFDYVNFKDSTFYNCKFINCSFIGSNLIENSFTECFFNQIDFSSIYGFLNNFKNSLLDCVTLSGSLYFSIMNNCRINQCIIDAYLLGYVYGLMSCKLIKTVYQLGSTKTENKIKNAIEYALEMYQKRFMYMNIGFLELLDKPENLEKNIYVCLGFMKKSIDNNIILKKEEATFLNFIIKTEYSNKNLSSFSILCYYNIFIEMLKNNTIDNKTLEEINSLKNLTYIIFLEYLDSLSQFNFHKLNTPFVLYIKYKQKPEVSLEKILNNLNVSKDKLPAAKLLKTEQGSYLEWISCIPTLLPYFQLLLDFLGIAIPIILEKKKNKENSSEITIYDNKANIELSIKDIAHNQKQVNPIIKVITKEKFTPSNHNKGYTKTNITEIHIKY